MAGEDTHAAPDPTIFFVSLIVGVTVLVLVWLIRRGKDQPSDAPDKNTQKKQKGGSSKPSSQKPPKKKQPVAKQKPITAHQFSHPELITSLKGHSGQLTGGGFSANGKNFISTADGVSGRRFDPGGRLYVAVSNIGCRFPPNPGLCTFDDDNSSSTSLEEGDALSVTSSSSSSSSGCHISPSNTPSDAEDAASTSKMSRRQRKNKNKKGRASQVSVLASPAEAVVCPTTKKMFDTLHKTEQQLYDQLLPMCCGVEDRVLNGYPYVTNRGVFVFKTSGYSTLAAVLSGGFQLVKAERNKIEANVKNILDIEDEHSDYSEPESLEDPSSSDCDQDDNQDASSGISSDSKESEDCKFINCDFNISVAVEDINSVITKFHLIEKCKRCKQNFNVNDNGDRECEYHPKRIIMRRDGQLRYQCCNKLKGVQGCARVTMHVYHHLKSGLNGPLRGYIATKSGRARVLGLDCEMVFTSEGFELARVSLVNISGLVLLDLYVRPKGKVYDYNTQFSGITASHLTNAVSFNEAREKVLDFISSSSILIGHSLEGDLAALKIVHRNIIDTALLFKTPNNCSPLKQSLKTLAKKLLSRDIQRGGRKGHNSIEDATAVLDLVLKHFIESHKVNKIAPLPIALQNVM